MFQAKYAEARQGLPAQKFSSGSSATWIRRSALAPSTDPFASRILKRAPLSHPEWKAALLLKEKNLAVAQKWSAQKNNSQLNRGQRMEAAARELALIEEPLKTLNDIIERAEPDLSDRAQEILSLARAHRFEIKILQEEVGDFLQAL